MKAKYLIGIAAFTLALTACDNYFDEKYMDNGHPQIIEVKTYEYTLQTADYASIANNTTNKAIAQELDSVKNTKTRYQNALKRVGENFCFNNNATDRKSVV